MNKEQAINNLEKIISTPKGNKTLYGLNLLPDSSFFGLITYDDDGTHRTYFNIDCHVLNEETLSDQAESFCECTNPLKGRMDTDGYIRCNSCKRKIK